MPFFVECKEYQRPATVYLSSLKPNAEVVQKQAKQCSNDNKLIIGGEAAKWAEFPHMAALGYRDDPNEPIQYKCGGSLISDHFVLTAAHCIGQSLTTVRLGSLNLLSSAAHEYEVEDTFSHPQYSAKSKHNDIALVKTFEKVPFSAEVRPACLYQTANVAEQKLTASGYGARENCKYWFSNAIAVPSEASYFVAVYIYLPFTSFSQPLEPETGLETVSLIFNLP